MYFELLSILSKFQCDNSLVYLNKNLSIVNAKAFWDWFITNETYIREGVDNRKTSPPPAIFSDFFLELENYCSDYSYMIAPHPCFPDFYRFTITADGDRSRVLGINHLMSNAPKLPYWKFKALFGPEEYENDDEFELFEHNYTFMDHTFNPKEVQVFAVQFNPETQKTELQFLLPFRFSTYDQGEILMAFEFFLMEVLGEMEVYERIDFCTITYHEEYAFTPMENTNILLDASEDGSLYSDF